MFDDFGQFDYTGPSDRDPYFDGMAIETVWAELDRLEREAWEDEMQYEQMRYEQNGDWGY